MYRFGDIFPISYDTLSLETDRIQYCSWTKFEVAEMIEDYFIKGLERGYIDESIIASEEYRPRLITNSAERKEKVITSIKQEMETCDEFMFSVAWTVKGSRERSSLLSIRTSPSPMPLGHFSRIATWTSASSPRTSPICIPNATSSDTVTCTM